MQYSPKLKKAAEDIKKILKQYDIAGLVVLHTPGFSEFICQVSPSYSCVTLEGDHLRIKAKKTDYPNKKQWQQKVEDSANMLHLLGNVGGERSLTIMELSKRVDDVIDAEHGTRGDNFTSHTTQNN